MIKEFDFSTGKVINYANRQVAFLLDDQAIARNLQSIFAEMKFRPLGLARDLRAAYELLRKHRSGVFFVDADLAEVQVDEILTTVNSQYPGFKVVIFSSTATKEAVQGALSAGALGYLLKPLKREYVAKVLEKIK